MESVDLLKTFCDELEQFNYQMTHNQKEAGYEFSWKFPNPEIILREGIDKI